MEFTISGHRCNLEKTKKQNFVLTVLDYDPFIQCYVKMQDMDHPKNPVFKPATGLSLSKEEIFEAMKKFNALLKIADPKMATQGNRNHAQIF